MIKKICDICGEEINTDPIIQCQNPLFEIKQIYPFGVITNIDLCGECSKQFADWIRSKKDGNGN